jgi:DNA helicase-2/ATP-dependent DNA helicase PcrA
MIYEPGDEQRLVLTNHAPVIVVLGGAGTGKTTTAAAFVRNELERASTDDVSRALFLSFSRAAVSQVVDRTSSLLGDQVGNVQITTFHAFAWQLIERWGGAIGISNPKLFSPSELRVFGDSEGLSYEQLIPLALRLIEEVPAVRKHLSDRWAVIVCDEFQDTSDEHYELLLAIRGSARLLLLGDLNQCIYSNLPGVTGVGPERIEAALSLPEAVLIELPDTSFRDASNALPLAASAIRQRRFNDPDVLSAISSGALRVLRDVAPADEAAVVTSEVNRLRTNGQVVAIFSHHHDSTATLSDQLTRAELSHEIVGIPEALDAALRSQFEMIRYAAGHGSRKQASRMLAIFVASVERGRQVPNEALMLAGKLSKTEAFKGRLDLIFGRLKDASSPKEALSLAQVAMSELGLTRGAKAWHTANSVLAEVVGARLLNLQSFPEEGVEAVSGRITERHLALLQDNDPALSAHVQLMGLYQAKGRESDATVVILRESDFYGKEAEPMPDGSKLLYVLLTRARAETTIVLVGRALPRLVSPLRNLAR